MEMVDEIIAGRFQPATPTRFRSSTAGGENGDDRNSRPRSVACAFSPCHCGSVNSMRRQ